MLQDVTFRKKFGAVKNWFQCANDDTVCFSPQHKAMFKFYFNIRGSKVLKLTDEGTVTDWHSVKSLAPQGWENVKRYPEHLELSRIFSQKILKCIIPSSLVSNDNHNVLKQYLLSNTKTVIREITAQCFRLIRDEKNPQRRETNNPNLLLLIWSVILSRDAETFFKDTECMVHAFEA